jgi:hypothetical protein
MLRIFGSPKRVCHGPTRREWLIAGGLGLAAPALAGIRELKPAGTAKNVILLWGRAYCNLLAGGGAARGRVIGKTDSIAGTPIDRPLKAKDVLATAYHLLGIDHHTTVLDRQNRPVPLLPYGDVIHEAVK